MNMGDYWYDKQFKRYVNQFAAIFQGLRVMVGASETREPRLIDVPIIMGPLDRVAAAAAIGHTQNRHMRMPMMSTHINGYELARDRMKGSGNVIRDTYVPIGGIPQEDGRVVYQRMAVPYDLNIDLYIYTSNKDQQFQILEQVFVLFNPSLQIQSSDGNHDPAKIVTVELTGVSNEENFPLGTESGNIVVTLSFKVDAYLTIPADVRNNLVQQVIARVSAVSDPDIGTLHSSGVGNPMIGSIYDQRDVDQIILADSNID